MNGINGPKGNNFDENYLAKSTPYNTVRANNYFVLQKGDWQVTRMAMKHGLYSGAYYGGAIGLALAIYKRQMRQIPLCAAYVAVPYTAFLTISTVYRLDI